MITKLREDWGLRPWWMNGLFYFCCYMTFIYMPFDLFFKPVDEDHEIWFGFSLTGWWAKATEPLHWAIYAAGAYGFWRMRTWMWPWAAVYAAQVVIAMVVWNLINVRGGGIVAGLTAGVIFAVPMVALWRAKDRFNSATTTQERSPAITEEKTMSSTLPDWAREHMRNYLATDGADGHIWRGVPTLLLTTTGSKSGEERMLPLIYGEDDGDYIIVASKGGFPEHPAWYSNLVAQPKVRVQVAADKFSATATAVEGERRQKLWDIMAEVWPPYIEYQQKTDRQIPVVVLTRD